MTEAAVPARRVNHTVFITAMIAAMVIGAITGGLAQREFAVITLLGDLFLNALKMMIIPLLLSSIINGVSSLGDIRKLGRLGAYTAAYYISTTVIAVTVGIIVVNLIAPGNGVPITETLSHRVAEYSFLDVVRNIVPANPIAAMADGNILPLIFFSIFFGVVMTTVGEQAEALKRAVDGVFLVSMKMVNLIVLAAPVGVFALVATKVGAAGGFAAFAKELAAIGYYILTVVCGLLIHAVLILGAIAWATRKSNPIQIVKQLAEPLLLAFSTASSSATLPVTMNAVHQNLGVDKRISSFVLPLGATVNMDGTALYEAVAAVFVAQSYGIDLSFTAQLTIVLTATLAAIGAAGIPQAGLVTLVMVLHTAGLPAEGIGLILTVDWLLDRFRTTVNVWGDAVGTLVVARMMNRFLVS